MQSFTSLDFLAPDATYGPGRRDPARARPGHVRRPAVRAAQRPDDRQHGRARPPRRGRSTRATSCSGWSRPPPGQGLAFEAAFENEFFLAYRPRRRVRAGRPQPVLQRDRHGVDRGRSSRTSSPRSPPRGSPSSCRTPSSGWGQQELSIRHARRSGRPTTRSRTARRSGRSPPSTGWSRRSRRSRGPTRPGSGAHLHWSIWDADHAP